MALVNSGRAIGAVSQLLHDRLLDVLSGTIDDVTVGRPDPPPNIATRRLNLFLYEIHFDEYLRNHPLDEGQDAPLWLVLRYIITAFDANGDSDSIRAHELLGQGLRVLNALNYLSLASLPSATVAALSDNPDRLKLTFDAATYDLVARIMQGSDEKYRCSAAFQVRPVLVAPAETPRYSQLVGIDYSTTPETVIGRQGVRVVALPALGPTLDTLDPFSCGLGSVVTLTGTALDAAGLTVQFGAAELGASSQRPDRLTFTVSTSIGDGTTLSAGSQVITVVQTLPGGRTRTSNPVIGGLQPWVANALPSALTRVVAADPASPVFGTLDLTGLLLGRPTDEVYLAFHDGTRVVALFDEFIFGAGPPFQTALTLQVLTERALPPGTYRVILRVNGQQSPASPLVDWLI